MAPAKTQQWDRKWTREGRRNGAGLGQDALSHGGSSACLGTGEAPPLRPGPAPFPHAPALSRQTTPHFRLGPAHTEPAPAPRRRGPAPRVLCVAKERGHCRPRAPAATPIGSPAPHRDPSAPHREPPHIGDPHRAPPDSPHPATLTRIRARTGTPQPGNGGIRWVLGGAPPGAPHPWVMRRRNDRAPREKALVAPEEEAKSAGRKGEQGPEGFQCCGVLERDFPELCARAGITHAPRVTVRPAPSFPADEEPPAGTLEEALARIERKYRSFQPRIQVEREQGDPRSVRAVFLRGWKLEEEMLGVLSQCLTALGALQELHLWNVPLPELLLPVLTALPTRCSRLRTLSLEGNPLPEAAFQLLMGSDSL
ncbi:leucine-rich repeat-containing protein 71 [Neopsephotus bourkii]|uniref:leucine-rich repeat-containing protein 71 n=1 Tax=Neopsephotus bourkii TaxID=309878 RepID=UPI002AA52059|nr:leucine-rich repeat-containing protein 71 [Neopsephotus bourkii]